MCGYGRDNQHFLNLFHSLSAHTHTHTLALARTYRDDLTTLTVTTDSRGRCEGMPMDGRKQQHPRKHEDREGAKRGGRRHGGLQQSHNFTDQSVLWGRSDMEREGRERERVRWLSKGQSLAL